MVKAVLFDIDGTLIDSLEANFVFFKNLMKTAGYPPPTRRQFIPLFHKPTWDVIPVLMGKEDENERKRIFNLAHNPAIKAIPPILSDGAAEAVEKLSRMYPLGVVTSRMKMYVYEPPLDAIQQHFSVTIAHEDTTEHKPNPEPLLTAAMRLHVSPAECVYIGDAETDRDAARAANMPFVLYVGNGAKVLDGARATIRHFGGIPSVLESL